MQTLGLHGPSAEKGKPCDVTDKNPDHRAPALKIVISAIRDHDDDVIPMLRIIKIVFETNN
jgi:hypothetical protein